MADPTPMCRAQPFPQLNDAARRHPLATRTGAEMLGAILAADQHWRPLRRQQQTALRRAYLDTLDAAMAPGVSEVPTSPLPAETHPATVRSLRRRGLVTDDSRLTALGVEVVKWAIFMRPGSSAANGAAR